MGTNEKNNRETSNDDEGLTRLRMEFLDLVNHPASWTEVWQFLVDSDVYQDQLGRCARFALHAGGAPKEWQDDIRQDALLLLARQLQRSTDLGYDADRPASEFGGWLRTILTRQSREAIRCMRRRHQRDSVLEESGANEIELTLDAAIDMRQAIDQLCEPDRTIMFLSQSGWSLQEIADKLGMTYWQVQYARKAGLTRLQATLMPGYHSA